MKYAFTICILLSAPAATLAQAGSPPTPPGHWDATSLTPHRMRVGLKGGFSQGNLQGAGAPLLGGSFEALPAWHVGAYARYGFTRFAAGQAELLYSRTNFQGNGFNQPAGTAGPVSHLDYVTLPLLFVANLSERLSLHLGPEPALLLAARSAGQPLDLTRSAYQRLALSGVLGLEVRCGPTRLGGRCAYGLRSLNPAGTATTAAGQPIQVLPPANDYHSLVLQAYLGVGLRTSRRAVSL